MLTRDLTPIQERGSKDDFVLKLTDGEIEAVRMGNEIKKDQSALDSDEKQN